ncbi:MAG: DEAD/DEAH box helicase [Steroidobacter sp.]
MMFNELGLLPELLRAVTERGYTQPTPVQARAIPDILAGRDMLAGAQTGTGKTAGFTLPLLQRLHTGQRAGLAPRALVLVPTRELAAQVADSVRDYGKHLSLRCAVIFGGVNINPQIAALRRGTDILVATPGRLLDHVQQRTTDLSQIELFVLDEADRMLDMGFIHDIKRVLKLLPSKRQNLMFSATYSQDIRKLAQGLLRNPVEVEVARRNTAVESVSQLVHCVPKDTKRALLSHLIRANDWPQALVFTRTKHGANRLVAQLSDDSITAAAIHGNKSQSARINALKNFKSGALRVLVATEVAARGLDIKELPYVVNYELPNVPEDYVHRIGRTGRAGATGVAISLVAPDETGLLKDIERLIGKSIARQPVPQLSTPPRTAGVVSATAAPPPTHHPARNGAARAHRGATQSESRRGKPPVWRSDRSGRSGAHGDSRASR